MIISAGLTETFSYANAVGIGSKAAIKLSELIIKNRPKRIIFIGSMGLYDKSVPLFSVHKFSDATNIEQSALNADGYSILELPKTRLNSSNYICTNEAIAQKYLQIYNLLGENMESFSVFSCAKYFNIQASAYLVATNYCDSNARKSYSKNLSAALKCLEDALESDGIL